MIEQKNLNDLITYVLLITLFILAAVIIKPIIFSIIYGVLLGYIFYPIYKWTLSKLKSENISAFLVCLGLIVIIIIIAGLILGSFVKQVINFSNSLQQIDIIGTLNKIAPDFSSSELSRKISSSLKSSLSDLLSTMTGKITKFILNIPAMLFQLFITIFVFFFSLRDGKKALEYLKTLSPLKKETHEKFFVHFKDITNSVLVGQVVAGIIQGLVAGIGYFILGVPNALLLTLLTMLVGIIPLIGPWLVWMPVGIYLFLIGRTASGVILFIYGFILINSIDTFIRPLIVSRKTEINSGIVLIGMIGGLFVFGIIGLIIGPLILAYVLLVLELHRKSTVSDDLIFKKVEEPHKIFFPSLPKAF